MEEANFQSETSVFQITEKQMQELRNYQEYDQFTRKHPHFSGRLVIDVPVYELLKENSLKYINAIQKLKGEEEDLSVHDLNISTMHRCGSFFLKESPEIVWNPKFGTIERETLLKKLSK